MPTTGFGNRFLADRVRFYLPFYERVEIYESVMDLSRWVEVVYFGRKFRFCLGRCLEDTGRQVREFVKRREILHRKF